MIVSDSTRDQTISTSSSTNDVYEFEDQVEALDIECKLPPDLSSIEKGGCVEEGDSSPDIEEDESGTISQVNEKNKEYNENGGGEDNDSRANQEVGSFTDKKSRAQLRTKS